VIEERRRRDRFLDLYHDDRLWANMIRADQDLLALDRKVMTDDVLYDLLKMGVLDWEAPNDRLNQTTPAMRHATAMQMRMLGHHLNLESKVCPVLLSYFKLQTDGALARSIGGGVSGRYRG
jgi:hypothetical protein